MVCVPNSNLQSWPLNEWGRTRNNAESYSDIWVCYPALELETPYLHFNLIHFETLLHILPIPLSQTASLHQYHRFFHAPNSQGSNHTLSCFIVTTISFCCEFSLRFSNAKVVVNLNFKVCIFLWNQEEGMMGAGLILWYQTQNKDVLVFHVHNLRDVLLKLVTNIKI